MNYPVTPDGRYFVVRGRPWRMANPDLDEAERADLVGRLMAPWRAVRAAKEAADREAEAAAHMAVDEVKRTLGERGPAWWDDDTWLQSGQAVDHDPAKLLWWRFRPEVPHGCGLQAERPFQGSSE